MGYRTSSVSLAQRLRSCLAEDRERSIQVINDYPVAYGAYEGDLVTAAASPYTRSFLMHSAFQRVPCNGVATKIGVMLADLVNVTSIQPFIARVAVDTCTGSSPSRGKFRMISQSPAVPVASLTPSAMNDFTPTWTWEGGYGCHRAGDVVGFTVLASAASARAFHGRVPGSGDALNTNYVPVYNGAPAFGKAGIANEFVSLVTVGDTYNYCRAHIPLQIEMTRPTIMVIGDSLSAGANTGPLHRSYLDTSGGIGLRYDAGGRNGEIKEYNWAQTLGDLLAVDSCSGGVGGTTITHWDVGGAYFVARSALQPRAMILVVGRNSIYAGQADFGDALAAHVESTFGAGSFVEACRAAGIIPIVVGQLPDLLVSSRTYPWGAGSAPAAITALADAEENRHYYENKYTECMAWDRAHAERARTEGVLFIPVFQALADPAEPRALLAAYADSDLGHMSVSGYTTLARRIATMIETTKAASLR